MLNGEAEDLVKLLIMKVGAGVTNEKFQNLKDRIV